MTDLSGPAAPTAVIGAGSWGTALAIHLGRLGVPTRLWSRSEALAVSMGQGRDNARYLAGCLIPATVDVSADPARVLRDAGLVILAVPSHHLEEVLCRVERDVPPRAILVSAAKGLEPRQGRRVSELLEERVPGRPVAVLSGPSFAREVAQGLPAALVVACRDEAVAAGIQRWLAGPALRLYTNRDVVGVELAGALKNVVAIATGLSDGLGLGDSARAALITRGLAEIARLGVASGAVPATFLGLAGLGDLVLTCTGALSRNHGLGRRIALGATLAEAEAATPMVAEGVRTVRAALDRAGRAGVSMPICQEVEAVLYRAKPVGEALRTLLARAPRPEEEPTADGRHA